MREQVCTYMCPWPRIQAAMLDEHSLTVTYNDWRGEPAPAMPRRRSPPDSAVGDCVDCNACVAVCPMGIDIRDGQQLECITCALCIDACDEVTDKPRPRARPDLLRDALRLQPEYGAGDGRRNAGHNAVPRPREEEDSSGPEVAHFHLNKIFRLRTLVYFCGLVASRPPAGLRPAHPRPPAGQRAARPQPAVRHACDGSIRNGYTVKLLNMILEPRTVIVTLQGLKGAEMSLGPGSA